MARDSMGRWIPDSGTSSIETSTSHPATQVMLQNMVRWGDIENLRDIDARIKAWDYEDNRVFRDRMGLGSLKRPNPLGMRVDRMQFWDNWMTMQKAQSAGRTELRDKFIANVSQAFSDAMNLQMNAGQRALMNTPGVRDAFIRSAQIDMAIFLTQAKVSMSPEAQQQMDQQQGQSDG